MRQISAAFRLLALVASTSVMLAACKGTVVIARKSFNTEVTEEKEEAGAEEESAPNPETNDTVSTVDPQATLVSAWVTRRAEAQFEVDCGTSTHYGASANQSAIGPATWISCPSDAAFPVTVALIAGENVLKIWFKTEGENQLMLQSSSSDEITIHQTDRLEIEDPSPHVDDNFGSNVTLLTNGNFVVGEQDQTNGTNAGAVHLYDGTKGTLIASIYGDQANDSYGGVTVLSNGNFLVAASYAEGPTTTNSGAIILVNGTTGIEIGRVEGDKNDDKIGSGGIKELPNGNYVLVSPDDDNATLTDCGSVILVSGVTGLEIGRIEGGYSQTNIGFNGVIVLDNGNYVISSRYDDTATLTNAGSVILASGTTGQEISRIQGQYDDDLIGNAGGVNGVLKLTNGNYVVSAPHADTAVGNSVGYVVLFNGTTGQELGRIVGDSAGDSIGYGTGTALPNGNYIINSSNESIGGLTQNGTVRLMNGTTGQEIGRIQGGHNNDNIGTENPTLLPNGNYIIRSRYDDTAGGSNAGSVILVDGATGQAIGKIDGDNTNDYFGSDIIILSSGNYVIGTPSDAIGGQAYAGSAIFTSGTTGLELSRFQGDVVGDYFGNLDLLANGNYTVMGAGDNGSANDSGTVILYDGSTGVEIDRIEGAFASDGFAFGAALTNGNYVVGTQGGDTATLTDAGTVVLLDGATGAELSRVNGNKNGDKLSGGGITALAGGFFMVWSPDDDIGALTDAGSVHVYDGSTGALVAQIDGARNFQELGDSFLSTVAVQHPTHQYLLVGNRDYNKNLTFDEDGIVYVVPLD